MQKKTNLSLDMDLMESIILRNAILDETYLASIMDVVEPSYFKVLSNKIVFSVIKDYFNKRGAIPTPTEIKAHLSTDQEKQAFKSVLTSFTLLDSKYNKEELYENTEIFLKERALFSALEQTIHTQSDKTKSVNPAETLDLFQRACNISLVDNMGIDYFKDIDQHIERMKQTHKHWSTGYPWLDKIMDGGFLQDGRSMYVFTGVPNSGKSIVLGNVTVNIAKQNTPVIVISMEMSEDIYAKRISSQLSKIPLSNIKDEGDALKTITLNHMTANPLGKIFIKEFAPKSVTVNHIKAYIEKLIQKKGIKPGAIVVDYVNLIQPTIVTGQSYADVKGVSEQLRALSYIFKCPVITASQLNRSAFDKVDPGMEYISESMGLSMTADFQAAIWSSDEDKEMGIIHIGIQKNRFGINYGSEVFRINYVSLVIENMKEDFTSSEHIGEAETSLKELLKGV